VTDKIKEFTPSNPANMRYRYGLTIARYTALLTSQNFCCKICLGVFHPTKNRPVIDHCHTELHVRGLLCHRCNTGIGLLAESPEIINRSSNYLTNDRNKAMRKAPTQGEQVLHYIQQRGHITQSTASSIYGISRLAAVVHTLRAKGHNVIKKTVIGIKGSFAEYYLGE
jgi:hypothetical protein